MQLAGFAPGSKLEVANGNFRGIGFGGHATVAKFDDHTLELDVRVSKLVFHVDVRLQFFITAEGTPMFIGGRPDGKRTGSEPAQVKHTMIVKSMTPDASVFELQVEDGKRGVITREVAVEKMQVKGADALRFAYDRYELTLVSVPS